MMQVYKMLNIVLVLLLFQSACLAQNTEVEDSVLSPSEQVSIPSDSLVSISSYNQGKLDASYFHPSQYRFVEGFGLGLILPFVSMAVSKAIVRGTLPLEIPEQSDSLEYTRGYLETTRLKNLNLTRKGAGAGSLISTTAILVAILVANLKLHIGVWSINDRK